MPSKLLGSQLSTRVPFKTICPIFSENDKPKQRTDYGKGQERVQTADRIIFNNKPVMLVPSNENEVLVLLSKLELLMPYLSMSLLYGNIQPVLE